MTITLLLHAVGAKFQAEASAEGLTFLCRLKKYGLFRLDLTPTTLGYLACATGIAHAFMNQLQ